MKKLAELTGWAGALIILLSYAAVSFDVLQADSTCYQLLNAAGAVGIAIISFYKKAYQPAILNAAWVVIAGIALLKIAT